MLDSLASRAWRGTPPDQTGTFLVKPSSIVPGTSPDSMREALGALYSHARRWAPGLDVPFFVPPVRIETLEGRHVGEFRVDEESYASVAITPQHVNDARAVLLILSHEACHHILRQSQLEHRDDVDLNEITTDLAMFICGFGDLVLRGHTRVSRIKGRNSQIHFGYLSSPKYQEAHAHVLSLRASQKLPGRFDVPKSIDTAAPKPLDVSALVADMLEAAALTLDTPAAVKDRDPKDASQSSARQLPSRRRDSPAPAKRPESPSGNAKKGMNEEIEWIQLNEKLARRRGLPIWIPVPKSHFDDGFDEKELSLDLCRTWINDFLLNTEAVKNGAWRKKNEVIVRSFEIFVEKGPSWDKAQKAFATNDFERAITALKRLVSMDPEDHAARLDLAFTLATMGDYPGALKAFKVVRRTFEGDPDYHVDLGRVHLALNDRDSALNEMVLALETEPYCQDAVDAMAQMGIVAVAEYLNGRRAETAAKDEEKARVEEAAMAKEKGRAKAAAEAEEKARLEALAKIKGVSDSKDTPPRLPDGFELPNISSRMRDDPLDMARLPVLQRQQIIARGQKALAEEAAKAGEKPRPVERVLEKALPQAAEDDAIFALVNLEPEEATRENVPGAAFDEALAKTKEKVARIQEADRSEAAAKAEKVLGEATVDAEAVSKLHKALAEAVAKAEKALAEADVETEVVAKMQKRTRADRAEADVTRLQERIRAEAVETEKFSTSKAEGKAQGERAAILTESARAGAASEALEKARLEALAKINSALDSTDASPGLSNKFDPPKALSRMRDDPLDTARLPGLSAHQRKQLIAKGQKALAEKAAKEGGKYRIDGSTREKVFTGASEDEALFALVDIESEGSAQEKEGPGTASAKVFAMAKEKVANSLSGSRGLISVDEAIAKTKETVARAEVARAEDAAKELPFAEAVAKTKAEEKVRDEGDRKEMALADAIAKTKEKVAKAKEKVLAETAANAKEKAFTRRKVILLIAALIFAVTLAILGRRMLFY